MHVSGFDVSADVDVAEDLYAMGMTVVIRGTIAKDLSVMAFSARTESSSKTAGNARLMGNTVTVEGPVVGALSVIGRDVILNAKITGDVRIAAHKLSFGPDAVVAGSLTYSTEDKIEVPTRVAPAKRVSFEKASVGKVFAEWQELGNDMPSFPTFTSIVFGFLISLLFFLALGALMLGFMPKRLARMRRSITADPGQTFMLGVIGIGAMTRAVFQSLIGSPDVVFDAHMKPIED